MRTLALLSLSLAVALGGPPFAPGVLLNPILKEEHQTPLLRDLPPMQGLAVEDDSVPQGRLGSEEQQKELAPEPLDMELSQNIVELELKVKPKIGVEHEGEVKTGVKRENEAEPQLKTESEVKDEQEVQEEQEVKEAAGVRREPEVKVESKGHLVEANVRPEVMAELQVNVNSDNEMGHEPKDDPEGTVETEVKMGVVTHVEPEVETEPEPEGHPDFKEESEVKVYEDVLEHEMKSMFKKLQDVEEKFQVQMNLEAETEAGQEFSEKHIDMEAKHEMSDGPMMELEPQDDGYLFADELTDIEVEKSLSGAPEKEGLLSGSHEEPIMEMRRENVVSMDEGPALDFRGRPIPSVEEYFPNEEARIGMEPVERSDPMVEAMSQFFQGEVLLSPMVGMGPFEVSAMEATKWCCCPGVLFEGKCHQFFRGPLKAADAEIFCQEHFTGGHLASITSRHIHRELMNMMLSQNGAYARTWIGGLRYLKTGRFIWLDGAHWGYADWLSGEPNNTSDVEDCIEVLPFGNGKFNDFTCWEPQAFICSYPYQ